MPRRPNNNNHHNNSVFSPPDLDSSPKTFLGYALSWAILLLGYRFGMIIAGVVFSIVSGVAAIFAILIVGAICGLTSHFIFGV